MLSAFVMTHILALEANCSQTGPYMEISNIIKIILRYNMRVARVTFLQIFSALAFENPRSDWIYGRRGDGYFMLKFSSCISD